MPIAHDRLVEFLQTLIRVPSLSGAEAAAVARVALEMRSLGFDEVLIDEHGSALGTVRGSRRGPTLLCDAHIDTVGVAPGVPWRHDPFGGEIEGGRLYGRGASDMKGALAAMVYATAAVDRRKLSGRVVISASVLEEVMEGAALAAIMARVRPDFVVIGESTELNLNYGGRGRAEIVLEAIGRPAHSSSPHLGVNAVYLMLPAIAALRAMPLPSDWLLGPALMELTDIVSEPYPGASVVPSRCRATFDRRLLAGETEDEVLEGLRALPELQGIHVSIAAGEHRTYTGTVLSGPKFFPAWKLDVEDSFVQAAVSGLYATGLDPKPGAYRFCTNAAFSAGQAGVPTVGFGPSAEGQAHVVDEYIELDQLIKAAHGYKGIIEEVLASG